MKTEFAKDMENLRKLWNAGQIKDLQGVHYWLANDEHPILCDLIFHMPPVLTPIRLEDIAERLPKWRKSKNKQAILIGKYGAQLPLENVTAIWISLLKTVTPESGKP